MKPKTRVGLLLVVIGAAFAIGYFLLRFQRQQISFKQIPALNFNQETWILLISCLGVLIAWLTYRVTALSRKETLPYVNVEWKTPACLLVHYDKGNIVDMYYFIEGIFTNSGGRAVSALELISGESGGFVYTMRLVRGKPITYSLYSPLPKFFILSQSFQSYLNNPLKVHHEKNLPLTKEIALDIPLNPGKSHRFTLCFVFRDWETQELKEENDILIGFLVRFSNGQTTGLNIAIGGGGPLSKFKRFERRKVMQKT